MGIKNLMWFYAAFIFLLFIFNSMAMVSVSTAPDEGQECFKVVTDNATYYYQKQGAGLSSMVDKEGRDWISYSTAPKDAGEFRGIPNLGWTYHPGYTRCTSTLVSQSSDKVVIRSVSTDNRWEMVWEFYSNRAYMTVVKSAKAYWWLYEGTPGGNFSRTGDYYYVPNKTGKTPCGTTKNGDLPESTSGTGEWICFGDQALDRVLFLVHHQNDGHTDKYYPMTLMTVFGFGRDEGSSFMTGKNTFSIGFYESTSYTEIKSFIEAGFVSGPVPVVKDDVLKSIQAYKAGRNTVGQVQTTIDAYVTETSR